MDNLRSVLNIVLSKIPTSLIVNSEIQYDNINRDTFVKIAGYYLKYYSNDELDNLFDYIKNEYEDQANYVRGFEIGKYEDKEGFSVFDAILIFATRVLQEIDGEPICRYENVLRWRFTSHCWKKIYLQLHIWLFRTVGKEKGTGIFRGNQ